MPYSQLVSQSVSHSYSQLDDWSVPPNTHIQYPILNFERSEHGGFGGLPPLLIYCLIFGFWFLVFVFVVVLIGGCMGDGGIERGEGGRKELRS